VSQYADHRSVVQHLASLTETESKVIHWPTDEEFGRDWLRRKGRILCLRMADGERPLFAHSGRLEST
jgi:hypothetical protein